MEAGAPIRSSDVAEIFKRYLEENGYRKTPERFAILNEIYQRIDHFDAEALYVQMKTCDYHVSRATVYNTLDLLVQCDLVLKHYFGSQVAKYEKSLGVKPHNHLICTKCGKIEEFTDERIEAAASDLAEHSDIVVTHHSLMVFGQCRDGCESTSFAILG